MMLYRILRIAAKLAFKIYFRRIYIHGEQHIPKTGACLFICNHPSSFLEACLLACFQTRDLYFLVRGDVFEIKWLKPILESTNQIPIYRFRDGFSKLRDNKGSFDRSYDILQQGKALLIFPEASTHMVRYLRPLQKGAARLVIGAMEQQKLEDIMVQPCGVFYHDALHSRRDVVLEFGQPLSYKEWLKNQQEKNNVFQKPEDNIIGLTQSMESAMQQVVPSVSHLRHEEIYLASMSLLESRKLPYTMSGKFHSSKGFEYISTIINNLNICSELKIRELSELYFAKQIRKSDLRKYTYLQTHSFINRFWRYIIMLFFFIMGIPGFLFNYVPLFAARLFSYIKIKHIEFIAPVRIAISMLLMLVWYLIFLVIFASIYNWFASLAILVGLFLSFIVYIYFMDWFQITLPFRPLSHRKKQAIRVFERILFEGQQ